MEEKSQIKEEKNNLDNLINKTNLQAGDIIDIYRNDTKEEECYCMCGPVDVQAVLNDITNGKISVINVRRPSLEKKSEIVEELIKIQNTRPVQPVLNEYEIYCLTEMINSIIEFGMLDLKKEDIKIVISKTSKVNEQEDFEYKEIMIQIKTDERVLFYQVMRESLRLNFAKLKLGKGLTLDEIFKDCNVVVTPEGYLRYVGENNGKGEYESTQKFVEDGSNTADEIIIS